MKRLFSYAAQHTGLLIIGGSLAFVAGAIGLLQPLMAMSIIQALEDESGLRGPLIILATAVVVGGVVGSFAAYLLQRAGQDIVFTVRKRLIGRLVRLTVSEVDRLKPGDLVARLTSDTTLLRTVVSAAIVNGTTSAFLLLGGIVLMAWLDLLLFGITFALIITVALIMRVILPRIRAATVASQEALGDMGSILERGFGAFRTIKANGAEDAEIDRLEGAARESWRKGLTVAVWEALGGVVAWMPVNIAFMSVLGIGGGRVAAGTMDVATLIGFLLLLFYLMEPISVLVQSATQLQTGLAAIKRIDDVADLEGEPVSSADNRLDLEGPLEVAFADVTFRYRDNLPLVHHGVTFEAAGRGLTALVGPSGAGKSTVFSLIERFYPISSGTVSINGTPVEQWPLSALRSMIGYVEQDAPVLDGTLRDNLLLAAPNATDQDLEQAIESAQLSNLVAEIPGGLDATIGHRGTTLSGGERQRVAIARALLRKPRLLLMDEATSQLDATNEEALRRVIATAAEQTNVIVVAHRLSTVASADKIVVMDAGVVRAEGTHEELIASDDMYRDLATSQLLTATSAENATAAV
ncbi:ABC transporter ATP-binding protein [Natronoglycomyces albus]